MAHIGLTYDMWAPAFGEESLSNQYAAMLEQCEYADRNGLEAISFNEHHGTDDGYNPSPITATAAVAARTRNIKLRPLLLAPLYDPLRLAEDLAVIDNISGGGRLEPVLGAGYRSEEFDMFDRDRSQRRRSVDSTAAVFRQAWTGEWFEYEGRRVRVTPRPATESGPKILMGGASPAAARAAARLADGFYPISPVFWPSYREECLKLGKSDPGPAGKRAAMFVHVAEDPDSVWPKISPYLLNAISQYRQWNVGQQAVPPQFAAEHEKDLRNSEFYLVLTPDEAVTMLKELGSDGICILRPMWGGFSSELAWSSLELVVEKVLPQLT